MASASTTATVDELVTGSQVIEIRAASAAAPTEELAEAIHPDDHHLAERAAPVMMILTTLP